MGLASILRPCALNFETVPTFLENLCNLFNIQLYFWPYLLLVKSYRSNVNIKGLKSKRKSGVLLDEIFLLFN
jgi:hypothetical protein